MTNANNKTLTIGFTGHRPKGLPWAYNEQAPSCVAFKKCLYETLEKAIGFGYTHFISGLAIGIDTIAAETVLELKSKYPNVTLEGAIPCRGQDAYWRADAKLRYARIIEQCDKVTYMADEYTESCMNDRNLYIAKNCDVLVAVWNGSPSGTGNTVKFAKSLGCKIKVINPLDFV